MAVSTRKNLPRLLLIPFAILLVSLPVTSHDPITTSVTFNKEVVRILQKNCFACHSPGKIKGDINLTSFEQARPWAKAIKEEVLEKRMPPFQAVNGFGDFQHSYLLSHRDVELLVSWIEGGAPRGEEKDIPNPLLPATGWSFGKPDLNLQPEQMITIPAGDGEYLAVINLPTKLQKEQWANAIEFIPANSAIVSSAEFFIANKPGDEKIGEWNPGQAAIQLPPDTGFLLPAQAIIKLKIRYRQSEKETTDHSILGIYFALEETARQVQTVQIKPAPITLAAGATRQKITASYLVGKAAEVIGIRPLLFPAAKSIEAVALRPDGTSEVLIAAQAYRFNWQPSYYFKKPVSLPVGTKIEVVGYLENGEEKPLRFRQALCELVLTK